MDWFRSFSKSFFLFFEGVPGGRWFRCSANLSPHAVCSVVCLLSFGRQGRFWVQISSPFRLVDRTGLGLVFYQPSTARQWGQDSTLGEPNTALVRCAPTRFERAIVAHAEEAHLSHHRIFAAQVPEGEDLEVLVSVGLDGHRFRLSLRSIMECTSLLNHHIFDLTPPPSSPSSSSAPPSMADAMRSAPP